MPTYTFPEVKAYREETGKCPTCGARVVRKWTATMTVSPYNRNPDGTVRSYDEVRTAVQAKADAQTPDFEHADCASAREGLSAERVAETVASLWEGATVRQIRAALAAVPRTTDTTPEG